MDNIQFWIYVVFAALYFLSRAMKKKPEQNRPKQRPRSPLETEDSTSSSKPYERPKSFEELLAEFTGESTGKKKEEEYEVEEPEPFADAFEKVSSAGEKRYEDRSFEDEGTKRSFADDESRRIYEESIKRAEDNAIEFSRDEKFLKEDKKLQRKGSEIAADIKASLQNRDQARKAVIYAEILNRRY
jgi:hypothetical protein